MYEGWKVFAYKKGILKAEEPTIRAKLKTWFDNDDWYLDEDSHRIEIFYGENQQKIDVSFQKVAYGSKRGKDGDTYHIVFESTFFGHKNNDERRHQELYRKFIQKISWKKQGFWIQDNAQIPIPKKRMLRVK